MYPIRPFTKSSKPETNSHTLRVIRWKETTNKVTGEKKPARSALCVSIPQIPIICTPAPFKEALQDAVYVIVDAFIRSKVEADFVAGKQPEPIIATDLEPSSLSAWFAEQESSKRLSKEAIGDWFDAAIQDQLLETLAAKISENDPDADRKLAAASQQFRNLLIKLASPQANFPKQLAEQLISAVELSAEVDQMQATLLTKLRKFTASSEDLLLSL